MASSNNMVLPIPHARRDSPYEYNGYKNQYPSFTGFRNRDIGETGVDPEVHGIVAANNMVPPIHNARRDSAYEYNGYKNQYPSFTASRPDIGETGLDPEVHGFASSNNMVLPIPHARRDSPYEYNGYKNVYPEGFIGRPMNRRDIGETGVDPEVHGLVSANNMVPPIHNARRDSPYEYNGYQNVYPSGFVRTRDVGEAGMDPEVHGLVSNNNMVQPIPHARRQEPYNYNGYVSPGYPVPGPAGASFMAQPKKKKDIGEKNVDPEVHGFVSANNMVEPTPLRRSQSAYEYNGGLTFPAQDAPAFMGVRMMPRKDIGEVGVDAEVHGLVKANNMVPPIPNARRQTAYDPNGSDAKAQQAPDLPGPFHYAQAVPNKRKDVGETNLDPEVHGLVSNNNMVLPIPHARRQEPYNPNGYKNEYPPQPTFAQKEHKDISPHDVRPDVYVVVSKIVNPVPVYRTPEAPEVFYEPWE